MGIDLTGAALTLDAGFDSPANREAIKDQKLQPGLSPTRRHTHHPIKIAPKLRWFARLLYRERSKVERTCGWQDT